MALQRRRPRSTDPADGSLRVLIVGPVGFVWTAIRDSLAFADIEVVGTPTPFVDIAAVLELRPHVVLVDADAAGPSWPDAVREVSRVAPNVVPVVLSARATEGDIVTALDAGAEGYLTKDMSSDALRRSIDGIRRGELAMSRRTAQIALAASRRGGGSSARRASTFAELGRLTPREQEILALMAGGLKDREVAERLSLSVRTVEAHVAQILRRLGVRGRSQAILRYVEATRGESPE